MTPETVRWELAIPGGAQNVWLRLGGTVHDTRHTGERASWSEYLSDMAWQSYLRIDDVMVGTWFNGAERACALLFDASECVVTDGTVCFRSHAREALQRLSAAGFHWELVVGDYSDVRDHSIEAAFLSGAMSARLGPDEYAKFEADLRTALPADELAELADLILQQAAEQQAWYASNLSGERDVSLADVVLFRSYEAAGSPLSVLPAPLQARLCRPLEYLLSAWSELPSVGWLLVILTLLHRARPEAVLVLDLSEGASPKYTQRSPEDVGREFFESAHASLERSAAFYGRIFASITSVSSGLSRSAHFGGLSAALNGLKEADSTNAERGRRLEDFFASLVELSGGGLQIVERNVRHDGEELDLVLRNELADPFWRNFNSPVILVECKNWSTRVDVNELRVLQTKMSDRGRLCSIGIFVGLNGFSRPFLDRVRDLQTQGVTIFPVEFTDMEAIVRTRASLADWLREDGLRRIL